MATNDDPLTEAISTLTRWYHSYHRVPLTDIDLWVRISLKWPKRSQQFKRSIFLRVAGYPYKSPSDVDLRPTRFIPPKKDRRNKNGL